MTIVIEKILTKEQLIKLYSNPVSGIACEMPVRRKLVELQDIRYSKSMLLKALEFWFDKVRTYYHGLKKVYNPLQIDVDFDAIAKNCCILDTLIEKVSSYPDSYLFSHRYINSIRHSKYSNALKIQEKILEGKLKEFNLSFQTGTLDPFFDDGEYTDMRIIFTVFPCLHPYVEKQKITKVGVTQKGNVYVLHGRVGAKRKDG